MIDRVVVALLEAVDERALVVRLEGVDAWRRVRRPVARGLDDLGQRRRAVDLRLAEPEAAQVGPVEQQDAHQRLASDVGCARIARSSSASVTSSTSITRPTAIGQDPALPAPVALLVAAERRPHGGRVERPRAAG